MTIFLIALATTGWLLVVLLSFLLGAAIGAIADEIQAELPDNVYEFGGSVVTWGDDDES